MHFEDLLSAFPQVDKNILAIQVRQEQGISYTQPYITTHGNKFALVRNTFAISSSQGRKVTSTFKTSLLPKGDIVDESLHTVFARDKFEFKSNALQLNRQLDAITLSAIRHIEVRARSVATLTIKNLQHVVIQQMAVDYMIDISGQVPCENTGNVLRLEDMAHLGAGYHHDE